MTNSLAPLDQPGSNAAKPSSDSASRPGTRLSMAASALLSVVLYLLLIDAAVETFLAGAPVRWIVAGTILVYLAFTVLLRRKLTLGASASGSLFILLGLLALTAWRPGGMSAGVVIMRQPTSTVLAAVTTLAVVLAGWILVRLKFVPLAGKAGLGFLTLYGVAALASGIATHTAYPDLFHGQSVWTRLPFWLQGTFVGTLGLVPAAVLVQVGAGLTRIRSAQAWIWRMQTAALGLSLVVALSGFVTPLGAPVGPTPNTSPTAAGPSSARLETHSLGTATPSELEAGAYLAERVESLFRAIEARAAQLPRDSLDPEAVVATAGPEPAELLRWVRDRTYWIPYVGTLRGPRGVLLDRLGNSLDRALLLAELLRLAGKEARLVRATLPDGLAAKLLTMVRPLPKGGVPLPLRPSREEADALIERCAREYKLDAADLRTHFEALLQEREQIAKQAIQQAETQARVISAAVGIPRGQSADNRRSLAARDHWWVQYRNDAAWEDLDPTLADAEPGQALVPAQNPVEPQALESALRHELVIRVVIERLQNGHLEEQPVLAHVVRPADLIGVRVVLRHVPVAWPGDLNLLGDEDPLERLKAALLAQHEWQPLLLVGTAAIAQASFTDAGQVTDKPSAAPTAGPGGLFGGLLGEPTQEAAPKGRLTAEWIEYEIRTPGERTTTIRREIFDLVGPAGRSTGNVEPPRGTDAQQLQVGLALLGETEILAVGFQLPWPFVATLLADQALANRQSVLDFVRGADSADPETLRSLAEELVPLPSRLYSLAVARLGWSRGETFLDRTNVLTLHTRLVDTPMAQLALSQSFDIVENRVSALPGSDVSPFLVRLQQGVMDTNAEAGLGPLKGTSINTAAIFAAADRQGIQSVMIRSADDPAWRGVQLPLDARARIQQDLVSGYVTLVPRTPVSVNGSLAVGWWRVDPSTGQALGIGDRGWGQTTVETAVMHARIAAKVAQAMLCVHKISSATKLSDNSKGVGLILCVAYGGIGGGGILVGGPGAGFAQVASLLTDVLSLIIGGMTL